MLIKLTSFVLFLIIFTLFSNAQVLENKMKIIAGTGEAGFKDGNPGVLNKPIRITPFDESSVIIADINNHAIRLVSLNGTVNTIAGGPDKDGYLDGDAKFAKFKSPHGVAFNSKTGELFVAEAGNHIIRKLVLDKKGISKNVVSTYAGVPEKSGFKDDLANQALFNSPHAIILNAADDLVIADIGNARIRIVKEGVVKTIAGTGTIGKLDGSPMESTFKYPMDMVLGADKNILIADAGTNLIRKFINGKSVSTVKFSGELNTPHGIACDENGNMYIADMGTHRILKIDKQGNISTLCGTGEAGSNIEQLNKPAALLVHAGYLWIADLNNHQIKAIKLN
jgi:DNA-binding beta-propeller fold protein YncE